MATGCSTNHTDTLLNEARILDSLQKYKEAIALYDKVLTLDSSHIDALFERAFDKGSIGDPEGEIRDLTKILDLDSANTLALFNLGIKYGNLLRYKESIKAFNKAIQTKGGELLTFDYVANPFVDKELYTYDVPIADIRLERGIVHYKADSVRKAYFDFTFCIENKHELKDSYYYRGRAYLKSGMLKHACKDLKIAELYGEKEATEILDKFCR